MLNKKGFTLVEVIIAIALLGIISVSLISVFSSQLLNINRGTEITEDAYESQGVFEEIIHVTKEKIKLNEDMTAVPEWTKESMTVFGVNVDLDKLNYTNVNRNNKSSVVYLSERLAHIENKQLLTVEDVKIKVSTDANDLVADLDVAPVLTAEFTDNSSQAEFYSNLYRWYRTEPGVDPNVLSFPDDYMSIPVSQGANKIDNLIDVGANTYVVLTVTPVDIHGYRGMPVMSSNTVYIKGEEWRVGAFPWIDGNNNYAYSNKPNDFPLKSESLKALIDSNVLYVDPFDPMLSLDFTNGSLFIPMKTGGSTGLVPGNDPLILSGSDEFKLIIDKNINLSKDIKILNDLPMMMTSGNHVSGGNIYFHPYVKMDGSGDAVTTNGVVELIDEGVSLEVKNNIYLETLKGGSIYLYGESDIYGKNIQFLARGSIQSNNSLLHAKENIILDTTKDLQITNSRAISLTDTTFLSDTNGSSILINSPVTTVFKGGGWSEAQKLIVGDQKSITFSKKVDKVENKGLLDLSNTGQVNFMNSMMVDLEKPLKLNVEEITSDTYKLSTENYLRNISYANPKSDHIFTSPQQWLALGSGQSNIEFSATVISGPGSTSDLKFSFDGTDRVQILKNTSTQRSLTRVELKFRDKYAQNNIVGVGAFNYAIDAGGNITINIEDVDDVLEPVTISDIQGVVLPSANQVPVTMVTETDQFTGTVTWSGNPTTFEADVEYVATINLVAKAGYTLLGVPENFFKVAGSVLVTNNVNSGVVEAVFPRDSVDTGLVLHLDARSVSSGEVTVWQDESGKGNDAVEMNVNGIKNPRKNNNGYVVFNDDGLKIDLEGLELEDDMTIIAVLKPKDTGTWFRSIISQYPNSSSKSWGLGWMDYNELGFYSRSTSGGVSTSKTSVEMTKNKDFILAARSSLDKTIVRRSNLDGNQNKSVETNKNGLTYIDNSQDIIIGYHTSDQFGQVNIYEILMFNKFLTDEELEAIYTELIEKYD